MDFNYGDITDKMTYCCDEISDPTPSHVASRIAQDHDPIEAGSFVESDRIEKSWSGEKLLIRSLYHSDRIVSGIGPRCSVENEDVVGAAPTGDAPTTSELSTILLPTKVRLILEV